MKTVSDIQSFTVKAGAKKPVQLFGNTIDILDADSDFFTINILEKTLKVWSGLTIPFQDDFSEFIIDNTANANDLHVVLQVGNISVISRREFREARTYLIGSPFGTNFPNKMRNSTLNGGVATPISFPGTNNGHRRRTIIVENASTNSSDTVRIYDSVGNIFLTVHGGDSPIALTTDAAIQMDSSSTGAATDFNIHVAEIFYAN